MELQIRTGSVKTRAPVRKMLDREIVEMAVRPPNNRDFGGGKCRRRILPSCNANGLNRIARGKRGCLRIGLNLN